MAKRRSNQEGTIYQRENGTWRAQVTLDGQRLNFRARTQRECQGWLKKTIGRIDDGMTYASTKTTLEEYMSSWLESSKASLRETTWSHYKSVTDRYIVPKIGRIKLIELRGDQIQTLYDHMVGEGIGIPTVIKVHTVLQSALSHAVKAGKIGSNPVQATLPPRAPSREMSVLDESQVNTLLIASKRHRLEALWHLAITTGMRQMELLGLKWTDLDWDKQTLKVERQLVRSRVKGIQFLPPKTNSGRRTLSLGSNTISALKDHHKRLQIEKQAVGESWVENGLIFTNALGKPIDPRRLLKDFKKLLNVGGLPEIRFHDLRHTSATLMLNQGIPIMVVSRRLGHARPSITLNIYGHLIPSMDVKAAEKLDELVTPIELHQIAPETTPRINIEA
jgi:integrase